MGNQHEHPGHCVHSWVEAALGHGGLRGLPRLWRQGPSHFALRNDCKFCTTPHAWCRCHMYGLGIYLADMAQKSHRYVSEASQASEGGRECKMVVCSVLLGDALQVEGHLKCSDSMHSVHSLRAMGEGDLPKLMDFTRGINGKRPVDQKDILFVKGLGCACRPGFSVFNSEYISFHPYQSMPRYEITYVVG